MSGLGTYTLFGAVLGRSNPDIVNPNVTIIRHEGDPEISTRQAGLNLLGAHHEGQQHREREKNGFFQNTTIRLSIKTAKLRFWVIYLTFVKVF